MHELEIDVNKLKEKLGKVTLIDVRENMERNICHIEPSSHLPLGNLMNHIGAINKNSEIVLYCHSGERSFVAARYMRDQGFKNVKSLAGGINEWAHRIDPIMRRY
ncbi:MAG: rhodanese-like domain-containing protein [Candidatus Aenigmatarchaeota archaeon]